MDTVNARVVVANLWGVDKGDSMEGQRDTSFHPVKYFPFHYLLFVINIICLTVLIFPIFKIA